jgi:hypothetical protein
VEFMEYRTGSAEPAEGYEPPAVHVHGSLAEATSQQIIGTNFDQTIPAGTSILGILGRLSF